MESLLEFSKFAFFLEQVFYQASSSFLHFVKSSLQPADETKSWIFTLGLVLRVPDVVRYEFFYWFAPGINQGRATSFNAKLVDESVDVFNQDVVSCYQDFVALR